MLRAPFEPHNKGRNHMKLVRTVFIAMAVLLPVSWTVAKAADPAPAAETDKKDKKSKTEKTEKSEKTTKTEKTEKTEKK